ncbi:hypothetical protein AMTR_s00026p00140440 [Amborella trichopoda]|uniref:Uncharacterized protein n=1 Tax=Amborella trichopoda TaxID=13333 RepID=W1PRP7_AMBTC|nr:hypothetical protein AMTR_s00026p00140440 [Amborella trichopoda]
MHSPFSSARVKSQHDKKEDLAHPFLASVHANAQYGGRKYYARPLLLTQSSDGVYNQKGTGPRSKGPTNLDFTKKTGWPSDPAGQHYFKSTQGTLDT